jgi:hypothetical protein
MRPRGVTAPTLRPCSDSDEKPFGIVMNRTYRAYKTYRSYS